MNVVTPGPRDYKILLTSMAIGIIGLAALLIGVSMFNCPDEAKNEAECTPSPLSTVMVGFGILSLLAAFIVFHYAGFAAFGLWWLVM
jgi:hypothetical protein